VPIPLSIIYSVWRLDAADAALAKGLVDKAIAATAKGPSGQGCFDRRYPRSGPTRVTGPAIGISSGSADLVAAAGFPSRSTPMTPNSGPRPRRSAARTLRLRWLVQLRSLQRLVLMGRREPWDGTSTASRWKVPTAPRTWSGGAIARGITVTTGVVSEPYLDNIPHLEQLLQGGPRRCDRPATQCCAARGSELGEPQTWASSLVCAVRFGPRLPRQDPVTPRVWLPSSNPTVHEPEWGTGKLSPTWDAKPGAASWLR